MEDQQREMEREAERERQMLQASMEEQERQEREAKVISTRGYVFFAFGNVHSSKLGAAGETGKGG